MKRKNDWETESSSEVWTFLGIGIVYWVVVLGLILVGSLAYMALRPTLIQMETNAVRESNEYITSTVTAIQGYINEYQRNQVEIAKYEGDASKKTVVDGLKAAQIVLIDQIYQKKELISKHLSDYPDIEQFLREHPNQ